MKRLAINCCRFCEERYSGCHDKCKIYKAEKQEVENLKEKIRNERKKDKILPAYFKINGGR